MPMTLKELPKLLNGYKRDMKFTFGGYEELINLLHVNGYKITDYYNWKENDKCVILRHDVDIDLKQALKMAEFEVRNSVKSTYFVLLTSNFYNMHSQRSREILNEIQNMGHMVGLHFDEMAYPQDAGNACKVTKDVYMELKILSEILKRDITVFSYHRPTKAILDADIELQGAINSYGNLFFRQFKYLSDSRMFWREPVTDIICGKGAYAKLHILTHPFWYHEEEKSMEEILHEFLNRAKMERYDDLNDNFTGLENVVKRKEFG